MAVQPIPESALARAAARPPAVAPAARHDGVRILLAEDNGIAAELLRLMGRRLGAQIDWVENGLDAVNAVLRARDAGNPYALLLIDAMMPVLSGTEATQRLRSSGIAPTELPIVAVTAVSSASEVRGFFDAGMQAYMAKPVSLADLSACINAWAPDRQADGAPMRSPSLTALRKRYDQRRAEVFALLEAAAAETECSVEAGAELRNHLHKLAGTAGSFGEDGLSRAAAEGAAMLAEAEPTALITALNAALARLKDAG